MSAPPPRLKLLDPAIRQLLEGASEEARRRAASTVSRLAADRLGLSDPRLQAALERLRRGEYGDSPERRAIEAMTKELDESAWDIQDRVEAGAAAQADYVKAFRIARAANAVWCALDADPMEAAVEATYEAGAAIDDPTLVRATVTNSVTEPPVIPTD